MNFGEDKALGGEDGKDVLKKDLLMGVTKHCVSDFISNQQEARKVLVSSIATNIYQNLRINPDISKLLTDVLDPANCDKDTLLKNLMSTVSSALQESLNKENKTSHLASDGSSHPTTSDSSSGAESLRSSVVSTVSANQSFDKDRVVQTSAMSEAQAIMEFNSLASKVKQGERGREWNESFDSSTDSSETGRDNFVYESSCRTSCREFELGKNVARHEVPMTVEELNKPGAESQPMGNGGRQNLPTPVLEFSSPNLNRADKLKSNTAGINSCESDLHDKKDEALKSIDADEFKADVGSPSEDKRSSTASSYEENYRRFEETVARFAAATDQICGTSAGNSKSQGRLRPITSREDGHGEQSRWVNNRHGSLDRSPSTARSRSSSATTSLGFQSLVDHHNRLTSLPPRPQYNSLNRTKSVASHTQMYEQKLKAERGGDSWRDGEAAQQPHLPSSADVEDSPKERRSHPPPEAGSVKCQHQAAPHPYHHQSSPREGSPPANSVVGQVKPPAAQDGRQEHDGAAPAKVVVVVDKGDDGGRGGVEGPKAAEAGPVVLKDASEEDRCGSRLSQRSLSPLSVGPIPSPIDPVQEAKAEAAFELLYKNLEQSDKLERQEKVESKDCSLEENFPPPLTYSEFSQAAEQSTSSPIDHKSLIKADQQLDLESEGQVDADMAQPVVHIIPISLVDTHTPDKATSADYIDVDKLGQGQSKLISSSYQSSFQLSNNSSNTASNLGPKVTPLFANDSEVKKDEDTKKQTTEVRIEVPKEITTRKIQEENFTHTLPPLEDPSVILLSPTRPRKAFSVSKEVLLGTPTPDRSIASKDEDYADLESLAEEIHHVKEDKARSYLHSKLKDSVTDMIAYQKHNPDAASSLSGSKNHYHELKAAQKTAQEEFHRKLINELSRESGTSGVKSKVAEALGTSFEVKKAHVSPNQNLAESGFSSVPSKSPVSSRRQSSSSSGQMDTWMNKSAFWSNSLPRSMKPARQTKDQSSHKKRMVKFEDEGMLEEAAPPVRPPPPLPERLASINTVKEMAHMGQRYNVRQESSHTPAQSLEDKTDNGLHHPEPSINEIQPSHVNKIESTQMSSVTSEAVQSFSSKSEQIFYSSSPSNQSYHGMTNSSQSHAEGIKKVHDNSMTSPQTRNGLQNNHMKDPGHVNGTTERKITPEAVMRSPSKAGMNKVTENIPPHLAHIQSVELRGHRASNWARKQPQEDEYKLDIGERKDRWMELYGNSVLNNTLHDRIYGGGGKLQKSQSAIWNNNAREEIIEHAPVVSTDRLEKPKPKPRLNEPNPSPSLSGSATLPRRWGSSRMVSGADNHSTADVTTGSNNTFSGRRNASMSNVYWRSNNSFISPGGCERVAAAAAASPNENARFEPANNGRQMSASCTNLTVNGGEFDRPRERSAEAMSPRSSEVMFQVPPDMVKRIVVSVLEKQGVPNPSDEILNRAIQEYYSKNPQGVFVGSGSDGILQQGDRLLSINNTPTNNITHVEAQNMFKNSGTSANLVVSRLEPSNQAPAKQPAPPQQRVIQSGMEDRGDKVHTQPYRTTPLVLPQAKTIHDIGHVDQGYTSASGGKKSGAKIPMETPYRSSPLILPGPKTINEAGVGAPIYQPPRGPQYNTQVKAANMNKFGQYNAPQPIYSEEALANPTYVQGNKLHLPTNKDASFSRAHESETFKMVFNSEKDAAKDQSGVSAKNFEKSQGFERPNSQMSDKPAKGVDPLLKNTSINQSTSFKKVMYSVLGESQF